MQQQRSRWPGFDKSVETKLRWDVYIRPWPPGWSFWRRIYTSRGSERVKKIKGSIPATSHGNPAWLPSDKRRLDGTLGPFFAIRPNLWTADRIVMYGSRVVVPARLQQLEVLHELHSSHQAKTALYAGLDRWSTGHPSQTIFAIRILNTTQNWVDSKAFRSIAHQTWYMETMLQWTQNWSKIKTKLGQGKC